MSKQRAQAADEYSPGVEPESTQDNHADDVVDPREAIHDSGGEARPKEYGGRNGLDPVRYGDWEKNGRCIDF